VDKKSAARPSIAANPLRRPPVSLWPTKNVMSGPGVITSTMAAAVKVRRISGGGGIMDRATGNRDLETFSHHSPCRWPPIQTMPGTHCGAMRSHGGASNREVLMDTRKLIIPALVLAGGAVLGRVFGLPTLLKGLMGGAALAKVGLIENRKQPRKAVQRNSQRKGIQRRSRPVQQH
jgi:hypothetical protein